MNVSALLKSNFDRARRWAAASFFLFALSAERAAGFAASAESVYLPPRSIEVSSFDDTPTWAPPANAMALADGDLKSRWASKAEDGQWVTVHFAAPKVIDGARLFWERAFASSYAIDVSLDGKRWRRVALKKKSQGGIETLAWKPLRAQRLRLLSLERVNPQWGVSLWEIEAYGPSSANPADRPLNKVFPWRTEAHGIFAPTGRGKTAPVPSPGPILPEEFQAGINLTSWNESEFRSPESDQTLEHLRDMNVRHVALLTTWFQATPEAAKIEPQSPLGGKTPTDSALAHAINTAHSLGIKVMLKPHLDVDDGTYRGNIFPEPGWFDSYWKFIKHYAEMARDHDVEMFCIGVELRGATTWEREQSWRNMIARVRAIYKGPIVYAANWDEYQYVPFWDAVDYIGIDAYFPLTHNRKAELDELTEAWDHRATKIEAWRNRMELAQPILFTELGYPSVEGANVEPWAPMTKVPDRRQQADCYQAAFQALTRREWFRGFYWWHYFPGERPLVEDLTLRGKPAEDVMSSWYKKMTGGNSQ